jgi:hypothetical protein
MLAVLGRQGLARLEAAEDFWKLRCAKLREPLRDRSPRVSG